MHRSYGGDLRDEQLNALQAIQVTSQHSHLDVRTLPRTKVGWALHAVLMLRFWRHSALPGSSEAQYYKFQSARVILALYHLYLEATQGKLFSELHMRGRHRRPRGASSRTRPSWQVRKRGRHRHRSYGVICFDSVSKPIQWREKHKVLLRIWHYTGSICFCLRAK